MSRIISSKRISAVATAAATLMPFIAFGQTLGTRTDVVEPVTLQVLAAVNVLVGIVFVLSVAVFGWGVVKFILAAGDPTQIAQAKQFLWWGVIGMGIGAFIFGVLNWVAAYFGIATTNQLQVPPPQVGPYNRVVI
jgi:hypothetical protein